MILFVTAMVVGFCVPSAVRDVVLLVRLWRRDAWPEPAVRRDRIFGSIVGLLLVAVGLAGVLRYHLG